MCLRIQLRIEKSVDPSIIVVGDYRITPSCVQCGPSGDHVLDRLGQQDFVARPIIGAEGDIANRIPAGIDFGDKWQFSGNGVQSVTVERPATVGKPGHHIY